MLVAPHDGSLLLVFQNDHAGLAGRLASAWPEEFIAHRDRRSEVIEAVARHDAGWQASDARGVLDGSTGRPASFLGLPLAAYPPIWASSIEEASRQGPLAEYLVACHSAALAGMERPGEADAEGRAALRVFREATKQEIARLAGAIAPPPTSGPYLLAETGLENDFRFLQFNDILSLVVCGGHAEPRLLTFLRGSRLADETVKAKMPEPFTLLLTPWVFEPERVESTVPVRAIPDRAYPDQAALTAAIASAPPAEQPIRIEPL